MAHDRHRLSRALLPTASLAWVFASLLVVLIVFDPKAASAANPLQLHGALVREHDVGIVAHRGAATLAPENTLASFRLALEQEVEFVETDVQLTADGVPVLMHDPDVDRTTNGHGPLARLTLAQLQTLDAGSWFSADFAGEPVPTLEDFLDLLTPTATRAFLELKGDWSPDRVDAAVEQLRARNLANRVVLASFERRTLESVRELAPEFATILLTRTLDRDTIRYATTIQASAVCARDTLIAEHPAAVRELKAAGIGTIAYTLNSERQWARAEKLGVHFFVTDDAAALSEWRDQRSA